MLNAKQHAREAEIVAQAGTAEGDHHRDQHGRPRHRHRARRRVEPQILALREDEALPQTETRPADRQDAQRMAGAATTQVIAAGGLHIVGTERHESRRIDNQLRGRSGRQGDPGSSRFYLSLEDPLLRIFGGERLSGIMQRLKMPEGEPIEHPIVNRSIAKAQNRVESRNFDIRKQLLEYDDVANDQRRVIYQQRNELLETDDVSETIRNMIDGQIEDTVRALRSRPSRSRSSGTSRRSRRRSPREYQVAAAGRPNGSRPSPSSTTRHCASACARSRRSSTRASSSWSGPRCSTSSSAT